MHSGARPGRTFASRPSWSGSERITRSNIAIDSPRPLRAPDTRRLVLMGNRHPILTAIAPPFVCSMRISKMGKDTRIVLIHTGRTDLEQSGHLSFARPTLALL